MSRRSLQITVRAAPQTSGGQRSSLLARSAAILSAIVLIAFLTLVLVFGIALSAALIMFIAALVIIGVAIVVFRGLGMRFTSRR